MKAVVCQFDCKGRDIDGREVLTDAVPVTLTFEQCNLTTVVDVKCQYTTGGHGQRCSASHPGQHDLNGEKAYCPYVTTMGRVRPTR